MQPTAPTITSSASSIAPTEPKEKRTNLPTIILTLTTVIFAGLALFFGIKYLGAGSDASPEADAPSGDDSSGETTRTLSMEEEYAEVRGVMDEVLSDALKSVKGFTNTTYIESSEGMVVRPDGMNTYVPTRFALYAEIRNDNSSEENEAYLENKLEQSGFGATGILPFRGSAGPRINGYANSNDIVCGVYSDTKTINVNNYYDYTALVCAKRNWTWLTSEERALLGDLEAAYYNKQGEYPVLLDGFYGNAGKVIDSEYAPYQTLWISVGGARGMFYRTSPDSEWRFFIATQAYLDCADYNTDDLKKAYLGESCYNDSTQSESTVQL